jgi:CheY-like chemotaxis protein
VAAQKKQPDDAQEPLQGRKILVVDDEADARTFIGTVLEDAGAAIIEAADGDEALAMAAEEKPDLITLDISMPGRDGVEIFGELRRTDATADIPVCVVTGHPEFREVIYQRAVPPPDGYLDKPVNADRLVTDVRRILDLRERRG